jgi:uncharacterized Zn-binding protein involved in type VI secretion
MALVARSTLWFARAGPPLLPDPYYNNGAALPATAPNQPVPGEAIVHAVAQGSLRFVGAANVALHSTASSVTIGAYGQTDVVTVGSNSVTINGNVFVRGGLETLTAVELRLQDKVVRVGQPVSASSLSTHAISDADLDGAGIAVGPPAPAGSTPAESVRTERSFMWCAPYEAGAGAPAEESRWRLRGGGLHIERAFDAGARTVSYGLRINDAGEFEIVRHEYASGAGAGAGAAQRVFVAGRDAGDRPSALASLFA